MKRLLIFFIASMILFSNVAFVTATDYIDFFLENGRLCVLAEDGVVSCFFSGEDNSDGTKNWRMLVIDPNKAEVRNLPAKYEYKNRE